MLYKNEAASINLMKSVSSLKTSPQFDGYTGIILAVDDKTEIKYGSETGRVLRVECPWGTIDIAREILQTIKGYQYQPYEAPGAILDPAAELMDGVTVDGVYGGIYNQTINFGPAYRVDLSAPEDEETDHEIPYKSPRDRKITREFNGINSELSIQAGQIAAKVEKIGGDQQSFSWVLESDHHSWYANGTEVARMSKDGLKIIGEIRATSGKIGGFQILPDRLSYNNQDWGDYNGVGAYFGPNGIQLGSWNGGFHVDASGNLYANSGEFRGSVRAGMIEYGGNSGYLNGGGITANTITGGWGGEIAGSTITTANTGSGINTSLGYADFSDDVFNGISRAESGSFNSLYTNNLVIEESFKMSWWTVSRKSVNINGQLIKYLGWD